MFFFNVLSIVRLQWELFIHTPHWGAPAGMDRGEGWEQAKISGHLCSQDFIFFGFLKEKCCTFADLSLLTIK